MSKNIVYAVSLAVLTIFLSACATIVSESAYQVRIDSEPQSAAVKIEDETGAEVYRGETPTIVTLDAGAGYFSGKTYHVTISKPGYRVHQVTIRSSVDGWYWGNLLLGGVVGMLVIDPMTGAMWTLNPRDIDVSLSLTEDAPGFYVYDLQDIPKAWHGKLIALEGS